MRRIFKFDVSAAIPAAWALLWADAIRNRGTDYRGSHDHYLTASDVEHAVRGLGELTAEGKPWPTDKAPTWYGYSRVRFSGDLNGQVRDWLLNEVRRGRLSSFNFGRGHISGMRFRPAGEPVSDTEKKTMADKERRRGRERPVHFSERGWGSSPLCVTAARKGRPSWHQSTARSTAKREDVTCARCLNLMREGLKCA